MRILSKGYMSQDVEFFDNSGEKLDLHVQKVNIIVETDGVVKAELTVLLNEIDLLMVDVEKLYSTEGGDVTQTLINEYFIRKHFRYFLGKE